MQKLSIDFFIIVNKPKFDVHLIAKWEEMESSLIQSGIRADGSRSAQSFARYLMLSNKITKRKTTEIR